MGKSQASSAKRQKERAKQEKRRIKEEKRSKRRSEAAANAELPADGEDPDIAGIVPGPQPDPEKKEPQ